MPRRGSPYSGSYERQRKELLRRYRVCQWCGQFPSEVADHNPPLGFHTHVNGSGCCVLVASCRRCNAGRGRGGWWVANQRAAMRKAGVPIPPTWKEPPPGVVRRQSEYDDPYRMPPPRRPAPRIW